MVLAQADVTYPPLRLSVYSDRVEVRFTARDMHAKGGPGPYAEYAGYIDVDDDKGPSRWLACQTLLAVARRTAEVLELGHVLPLAERQKPLLFQREPGAAAARITPADDQ